MEWLDDPDKKTFPSNEALRQRLERLSAHQIAVWNREYMLAVLDHETARRNSGPRGEQMR